MTNVVTMKIPGTDEYEVPISFKTMKLAPCLRFVRSRSGRKAGFRIGS
jgi:hypothetical protein